MATPLRKTLTVDEEKEVFGGSWSWRLDDRYHVALTNPDGRTAHARTLKQAYEALRVSK